MSRLDQVRTRPPDAEAVTVGLRRIWMPCGWIMDVATAAATCWVSRSQWKSSVDSGEGALPAVLQPGRGSTAGKACTDLPPPGFTFSAVNTSTQKRMLSPKPTGSKLRFFRGEDQEITEKT